MDWLKLLFGKSVRSDSPHQEDNTALARITARVTINGNPENRKVPVPLLTLEEFFEGNDETGSIGCNLPACPEPKELYTLLASIRSRPDVSDVKIQVTCLDDPGKMWPFSDTVWIMTSADELAVASWFPDRLAPSETWTGWTEGRNFEPLEIAKGHHPVAVWFD